jgi:hypothetical protein
MGGVQSSQRPQTLHIGRLVYYPKVLHTTFPRTVAVLVVFRSSGIFSTSISAGIRRWRQKRVLLEQCVVLPWDSRWADRSKRWMSHCDRHPESLAFRVRRLTMLQDRLNHLKQSQGMLSSRRSSLGSRVVVGLPRRYIDGWKSLRNASNP